MHPLDRGPGIRVHTVVNKYLHDPEASVVNQDCVQQAAPFGLASRCIGTLSEQEPQEALDIGLAMCRQRYPQPQDRCRYQRVGCVFADVTVSVVPRPNEHVPKQALQSDNIGVHLGVVKNALH
ncbi:unnamed protein product [Clonostachys byssicola]|uniref:Uncharacterized protein n=1 Tax=Clonostachys byssicola TaxID=160290 RepID=A0A9N9Y468_9HYPO|nr:unnamed protein product [Clonostachys byssicola]